MFLATLMMSAAAVSGADTDAVALAGRGNADALLKALSQGDHVASAPNTKGLLPLVASVRKGDSQSAKVLLDFHADPSTSEPQSSQSAMTVAFANNAADVAELLLKYGGNPDTADGLGKTPRGFAKKGKLQELLAAFDKDGAEAFEDPPGTWEKHMSEEHNTPFYFNPATKEAVYQKPTSCAWVKTYIDGNAAYQNTITHQSRWTVPKALAWKHLHELETNSYYWFNYETGATSRNVPAELPDELATDLQYDSGAFWLNTATQESTWADPAESGWRRIKDPNGRSFYFNPSTQESTWERPEELSWRTATASEHDNRLYYVNDRSQEAVWEKPAPLAWQQHSFVARDVSAL